MEKTGNRLECRVRSSLEDFVGFGSMSDEQKKAALVKAKVVQREKQAARKASTLRRDFLDASLWEDLARERGLRLPPWGEPATMSNMRTWIHKIGWSQAECEDWAGCKLGELIERNSTWPLRALAGVLLEQTEKPAG